MAEAERRIDNSGRQWSLRDVRTIHLVFVLALGMIVLPRTMAGAENETRTLPEAKRQFASADADLNKTFQALRKKLSEDEFKELRDNQR